MKKEGKTKQKGKKEGGRKEKNHCYNPPSITDHETQIDNFSSCFPSHIPCSP